MKIAIIGTGYVGLVTGVCLAEMGHHVSCLDIDEKKIDSLSRGQSPIYERGLDEILGKNLKEKLISFTTNVAEALKNTKICLLVVKWQHQTWSIASSIPETPIHVVIIRSFRTPCTGHCSHYRYIPGP